MKYGLMLDEKEVEYVKQAIKTIQCLDSEANLDPKWNEWLKERETLSNGILSKIESLKSISTFKSKAYVTPDECFAEGITGNCGIECKYYGLEGCDAENE